MTDLHEDNIWMEGEDSRECGDCGHTSHSCTCYEKECGQCMKVINMDDPITIWDGVYYCDAFCLDANLNE